MYWNHSVQFWWLIPVFMFLMCLVMCFFMRRRGMAGCCMGWRSSREESWQRRTDPRDQNRRITDPSAPPGDETPTDLNITLEGLDQRIRAIEHGVIARESNGDRSFGHANG